MPFDAAVPDNDPVVTNLRRAQALIRNPADWARKAFEIPRARYIYGGRYTTHVALCPLAALRSVIDPVPLTTTWEHVARIAEREIAYLHRMLPPSVKETVIRSRSVQTEISDMDAHLVAYFNDTSDHAAVMQLFDDAIAVRLAETTHMVAA